MKFKDLFLLAINSKVKVEVYWFKDDKPVNQELMQLCINFEVLKIKIENEVLKIYLSYDFE